MKRITENPKMLFPTEGVFETHLSVQNRQRSVAFYHNLLGLPIALEIPERDVTFFWLGEPSKGMLGVWGNSSSSSPVSGKGHFAFSVSLVTIKGAVDLFNANGITPLSIDDSPTQEPIVIAWMPAVSLYFKDPDENSLELIHLLDQEPKPEMGIVSLSEWERQL